MPDINVAKAMMEEVRNQYASTVVLRKKKWFAWITGTVICASFTWSTFEANPWAGACGIGGVAIVTAAFLIAQARVDAQQVEALGDAAAYSDFKVGFKSDDNKAEP